MARAIDERTELPWLGWTFINHSFCFCHHHHWWLGSLLLPPFAVSMYVCCWMLPTLISVHADWCGAVGFYSTCFSEAFHVAWSPRYMHVEYHLFTFHYSRKKGSSSNNRRIHLQPVGHYQAETVQSNNKKNDKNKILWQVTPWRKRARKRNAHRQCLSNMCVHSFGLFRRTMNLRTRCEQKNAPKLHSNHVYVFVVTVRNNSGQTANISAEECKTRERPKIEFEWFGRRWWWWYGDPM